MQKAVLHSEKELPGLAVFGLTRCSSALPRYAALTAARVLVKHKHPRKSPQRCWAWFPPVAGWEPGTAVISCVSSWADLPWST